MHRSHKKLFPLLTRRYVSSNESMKPTKLSLPSFLNRFIEARRKTSKIDDIRLEPYLSKGVYTESGGIRPVN